MIDNNPTAWFFGCSMTLGAGCRVGDAYYTKYRNDGDFIFSKIVADTLGYNEKNMGLPGKGNIEILKSILDNKDNITTDDIVIVGITDGTRVQSFFKNDIGITAVSLSHWLIDCMPWRENGITEEFVKSLVDYSVNCRLPFISEHIEYDKALIDDVCSLINPQKYFSWKSEMWPKFENIATHTNNEIYDFHWSFNGHKEMAEWVLNNLK